MAYTFSSISRQSCNYSLKNEKNRIIKNKNPFRSVAVAASITPVYI